MYKENVRHPTSPTQWIIPYFKFNSNVLFGEKIRYLAVFFEKYSVQTIYMLGSKDVGFMYLES